MKLFLFVLSICAVHLSAAQVGIFENASDIGKPASGGNSRYDASTQAYSITGGGTDVGQDHDEFQFLSKKMTGDFILTANFEFVGTASGAKTGWMIRESDDDRSAHVSAMVQQNGQTSLQWRELRGAFMRDAKDKIVSPKSNHGILQLERAGNNILMRAAHWGEPLQLVGSHPAPNLPDTVLIGLFVSSTQPGKTQAVKVWNLRIDKPVAENYSAARDGYLGCRMEIINPFDGQRKVIFEKPGRFEAPNWMPDGKKLLFNMDGSAYKIPIEGGEPEKLNTGSASRLNNDHGISFDGKMLAISSSKEGSGSSVYVLPLEGGEPKLITSETPSYFHGWNPNNKEVVYVYRKTGSVYNVYKSSIDKLVQTQLTHFTYGHVDGPEYSPDGKYIYYNGNQSGTMQLWRIGADGTNAEQLTFDENNNWFPHISPDGKWILYISFQPDIPVNSHPSYKRVTLKLMPANGGPAKVVAYMYGGQGSINVPSWSPDSKFVAFVSNSGK